MTIDDYLEKMVQKIVGLESSIKIPIDLARDLILRSDIRSVLAQYAVDCSHDRQLAKEAMKVCEGSGNKMWKNILETYRCLITTNKNLPGARLEEMFRSTTQAELEQEYEFLKQQAELANEDRRP